MLTKTLGTITYGTVAIFILLALSQAKVYAQEDAARERNLAGVWLVTITPRNCDTGLPIPTAPPEALFTFHKDGTMSAWAQNPVITTTRSEGHGLWQREQNWGDYRVFSFKFVHLRYSLATGIYLGRQQSAGTLVLGESGDDYTTNASTTLFDVNGNITGTSCSTSAGTRFKL